jgi:hypothetical protein
VSRLLVAITTALSARLTSALPCMSPAPYASLIRKGIVDSASMSYVSTTGNIQ